MHVDNNDDDDDDIVENKTLKLHWIYMVKNVENQTEQ